MADGHRVGVLEKGRAADFIAVDGSPLQNISILQDKSRIRAVHIDGKRMQRVATLRAARLAAE
jgi:imidazolonepropionase-like amidohydrolase